VGVRRTGSLGALAVLQPLDDLTDRLRASEEHVLVFSIKCLQAAERRALGPARPRLMLAGARQLALDPLARLFGQTAFEVRTVGETVMGDQHRARGVVKRRMAELFEPLVLIEALFGVRARHVQVRRRQLAVNEQVRFAEFCVRGERVAHFELRAGRSRPPRFRREVGRQPRAEARPEDAYHQVTLRRARQLLLEAGVREDRLVLPQQHVQGDDIGELTRQAAEYPLGQRALRGDIARRGDKNAQQQLLGYGLRVLLGRRSRGHGALSRHRPRAPDGCRGALEDVARIVVGSQEAAHLLVGRALGLLHEA